MEDDYYKGISLYHSGAYKHALPLFKRALDRGTKVNPHYSLCLSYYGLTLIFLDDYDSGISHCIEAADEEMMNGDVFYNLAIAARMKKDRKLCLRGIQDGLKIDHANEKLVRLRKLVGYRRKPKINFLSRDHFLNIILGKLTHQNNY
jgi:tetratricopeptide (TPR) repeat protein